MNGARRNARGERSLQRILEATLSLVAEHGYDNTTIARITELTKRPASSIYWYFSDKDELIAAALENSYRPPHAVPPWHAFDPTRPLDEQLSEELEPELEASDTEEPLRLGIRLALEGSAAKSNIQAPFQQRRARASERIEAWWRAALARPDASFSLREHVRPEDGARTMGALTLAVLDGHYLSDVTTDPGAARHRSLVITRGLIGVERRLTSVMSDALIDDTQRGSVADRSNKADSEHPQHIPGGGEADQRLLLVTRRLVAEHGYDGATLDRICAASGLQRSSIYWRYKDKDALIAAAVATSFLGIFTPIRELPPPRPSWQEDLASAVGATLRLAQSSPDAVKAGLLLKVQRRNPPTTVGTALLEGAQRIEGNLAEWFARIPDFEGSAHIEGQHLAWAVTRLVEGFMLGAVLGETLTPAQSAQSITAMLSALTSESGFIRA